MFNYRQSQTKYDLTDKYLQSINNLIAKLPNINTNWVRLGDDKNRWQVCEKVEYILTEILYNRNKYLLSDEIAKYVIDKIEPYIIKLKKLRNLPSVQGKYAWFLEKKMNFCENEKEKHEIHHKILETYQSIFEKKPEVALWITRVNYLNFLSRKSEDCIPVALEFLKKAKTLAVKPNKSELARIYTILSIENEKKGLYDEMYKNAKLAENLDPDYAPSYSCLGKFYQNKAEISNNYHYYKIATGYFEKARYKDDTRFNKKHPLPIPYQKTFAIPQYDSTRKLSKEVEEIVRTKKINLKYDAELNPKKLEFTSDKKGLVKSNPRFFIPSISSTQSNTPLTKKNRKTCEFSAPQYKLKK